MKVFTYSLFTKFIYRYANIPVTLILGFYFVVSVLTITESWFSVASALIHAVIIIIINRYYFKSYKVFPYKIEINNDRMICSDYTFTNKIVELELNKIDKISGGIFGRASTRPLYIYNNEHNIKIGIHQHLKKFNELLTIILSNVRQELYNDLLEKIKNIKLDKRKK
jgi:hypothetical protein